MKNIFTIPSLLTSLAFLASSLEAQQAPAPAANRGKGFDISVGVSARQFGDLNIRTGSNSQNQVIPLFVAPAGSSGDTGAVGPEGTIGDRIYANGFVNIGAGTAFDGLTTFWGFDDASQISGDTLNFSSAPFSTTTSDVTNTSSILDRDHDTGTRFAPEVEIGYRFYTNETTVLRALVGFSWTQLDQDQKGSNFGQIQNSETSEFTVADSFSLGGIIPPLAPFAGTEAGPGPLIANIPTSRTIQSLGVSDSQQAVLMNQVRDRIDLDIYTFNAGLDMQKRLVDSVWVSAGAGLVLNAVDIDASHRESLTVSQNGGAQTQLSNRREKNDSVETSWGYYAKGGLVWQIAQQWSLNGYVRYDWNETVTEDVGPGSFSLDMDVLTLGAALQFAF